MGRFSQERSSLCKGTRDIGRRARETRAHPWRMINKALPAPVRRLRRRGDPRIRMHTDSTTSPATDLS
jgi:hypothetical protein